MLILSRKLNESIIIDGRIIIKVLRIEKDTVKLGIQAPLELPVHRQEVFDAIQRSKLGEANAGQRRDPLPALPPESTGAPGSSSTPS
jgi:carbon storage regulator